MWFDDIIRLLILISIGIILLENTVYTVSLLHWFLI